MAGMPRSMASTLHLSNLHDTRLVNKIVLLSVTTMDAENGANGCSTVAHCYIKAHSADLIAFHDYRALGGNNWTGADTSLFPKAPNLMNM